MPPKRKPSPPAAGSFTSAQIEAMAAAKTAGDTRTPTEVRDAFTPESLRVGDILLRPLTWADFMLLEQIESPFADSTVAESDETEITQIDVALAVWLLTRPTLEVRDLFAAEGRAGLERAAFAWAAGVDFRQVMALGERFRTIFAAAFASIIPGGQKKTATSPSAPPTTASAGG